MQDNKVETEAGTNGHDSDDVLGAFKQPSFPNAVKELVQPGKEVKELLMRTELIDINESRDLALTLSKLDEFHMEEEKKTLLYLLAARTSVKGKRADMLLQAITGYYTPTERRERMGMFKKKKEEESIDQ